MIEVWPSRVAQMQQRQVVPLSLLRTVSFVQDFSEELPWSEHAGPDGGFARVEAVFKNGQTLSGAMPHYAEGDPGFWLFAGSVSSGPRVFVVSSAVAEIRVS